MIRPSALNRAEECGLAPALAEKLPESSTAAASGHNMHTEIAALLNGIKMPSPSAEATWAVEWVRALPGAVKVQVEVPVELRDPETDEVITSGTADVVCTMSDGGLTVIDWKGGNPDNVPRASDNLQLATYAIGAGLAMDAPAVSWLPVFLRDRYAGESFTVAQDGWWGWIDRIKKASSRPPVATPGPHCGGCYQRLICDSYKARASMALTILPDSQSLSLTDETAAQLVQRIDAIEDALTLARDMAKAHVRNGGLVQTGGRTWGPSSRAGRKTPDLDALKAAGVEVPMKMGAPYEVWGWKKA